MATSDKKEDGPAAVAASIRFLANELGLNGATTHMGAIEVLALETKEGSERIAEALIAVSDSLDRIAEAIAGLNLNK